MARKKDEQLRAAAYFMERAQAAIDAAEQAPSEDAGQAFYKEAETWLYMAGKSLNPATPPPKPMNLPPMRAPRERRSFGSDD
ncbi:hypothetical protein [Phenylobacterium sp.]|uniref:hypothetical protein n=1 Tax=Phenylobacterium sp. TaxID=1871053 RepID=UPI0035B42190